MAPMLLTGRVCQQTQPRLSQATIMRPPTTLVSPKHHKMPWWANCFDPRVHLTLRHQSIVSRKDLKELGAWSWCLVLEQATFSGTRTGGATAKY